MHISATNEHLKFYSRTFHYCTVALEVTEVQMLQLTTIVTLVCNTNNSEL